MLSEEIEAARAKIAEDASPDGLAQHADRIARAFDEWMRLHIEEPARFEREWESIHKFLRDEAAGVRPEYGRACAAFLLRIMAGQAAGETEKRP